MAPVSKTSVNLFQNATLTAGRSGNATLERTVNPNKTRLEISNGDQFSSVEAIPLRDGNSDVVVKEQSVLGAQNGVTAKLAHYAKHGGEIEVDGKKGKVTGYDHGLVSIRLNGGKEMLLNPSQREFTLGKVKVPFESRTSPTIAFELGNTEGTDKLHLVGNIAARAEVSYRVTISDAANQDAIKAELQPRVAIENGTGADFNKMSLSLRLNEPEPQRFGGLESAGGMKAARAFAADAVGEISEGATSGVITMPIRKRSLDVPANSTKILNFAAAVNGTPNADMAFIDVSLKQVLSMGFHASPGELGKTQKSKDDARASYEMGGTKGPQPAGAYELYDGKDVAGRMTTRQYTEKDKALTIPGVKFPIAGEMKTSTLAARHGEWVPQEVGRALTARPAEVRHERVSAYDMKQALELTSKSPHARTVDVSVDVSAFDQGLEGLAVKSGGADLAAKYDRDEGTLTFRAPVGKNGKAEIEITYTGSRTEQKFEPANG